MAHLSPVRAALGRIAFVTGGAQGIGRAISCRLARDGYDVSISDIASQQENVAGVVQEIESSGGKAIGVVADVRDPKQLEAAIAETVDRLGPKLFVSVANAGILQLKPILDFDPESIENMMRINVLGVINTHIYAARQMVKQGFGGRIIAAGSVASYQGAERYSPYVATKYAVRGFTESAAKEWGRYGIRVNAYAPGIVNTELGVGACVDFARDMKNVSVDEAKAAYVRSQIPLGRLQEPEDVAKLVSFLASEEGEYITGQTIKICGGASR